VGCSHAARLGPARASAQLKVTEDGWQFNVPRSLRFQMSQIALAILVIVCELSMCLLTFSLFLASLQFQVLALSSPGTGASGEKSAHAPVPLSPFKEPQAPVRTAPQLFAS
jgi:hypothetical protein